MITELIKQSLSAYIQKNYQKPFHNRILYCCTLGLEKPRTVPEKSRIFKEKQESFQKALLHHIDTKGLNDVDVYKKAFIDRKLFSKIRSNPEYSPKKDTVLKFCFALELNLEESRSLLEKAGYALSMSSYRDIIMEFCIRNHIYDLMDVNSLLDEYKQTPFTL